MTKSLKIYYYKADILKRICRSICIEPSADDPTQRKPVIDLAKKELDWKPTIMLDEGLKRTIEYFRGVV